MKFTFAAVSTELLLSVSLAAFSLPVLHAERHCPGNVAILPFRLALNSKIIVPVVINHTGPYDFVVDTGTHLTTLDPLLAFELHLKTQGVAEVVGVGFSQKASFTRIDLLGIGSLGVANTVAVVQDLQSLQAAGHHIRGVLGVDFLGHFDLLVDYMQSILCLDDTKVMRARVKGVHVELATPVAAADGVASTGLLLIPVRLSGAGTRQLHLALDSGANEPLLYDPSQYLNPGLLKSGLLKSAPAEGHGADGVQRAFSVLLPQNLRIGALNLQQISFVVPPGLGQIPAESGVDGLLPTALFRRVFVSYADHFAVLDPQQ